MLQKYSMLGKNSAPQELDDRRRHARFKAQTGDVIVVSTPQETYYCFLVDISLGGISFEYIPVDASKIDTRELKIVLDGSNLRFEKLPSKSIFDIALKEPCYTPVKMRRRGVQFIGLTPQQISNLEWFIQDSDLKAAQAN